MSLIAWGGAWKSTTWADGTWEVDVVAVISGGGMIRTSRTRTSRPAEAVEGIRKQLAEDEEILAVVILAVSERLL